MRTTEVVAYLFVAFLCIITEARVITSQEQLQKYTSFLKLKLAAISRFFFDRIRKASEPVGVSSQFRHVPWYGSCELCENGPVKVAGVPDR